MNVNDQWMLEKMQQMAASMAASLPQTSQNTDTPEAGKGESFKDMMDKAVQDQKTEAPKKAETPQKTEKTEPVQSKEPAQKVQKTQKTVQIDPGTGMRQIDVTPEEAALLVAGYAKLSPPMEDGTVWMVTVQDENGNPVLPLAELEKAKGIVPFGADLFADTTGEWVLDEITPEFTQALEQLLAKTGDPRSAQDILSTLEQKITNMEDLPKLELVVSTPEAKRPGQAVQIERPEQTEQSNDQDDADPDAKSANLSQPLFKDVKAAPVKVGENFRTLDTQQPDMEAKLAETIRDAAQQGLRQIEIKLSPENLGNLTVKLTQAADGTLQVVLHTANAKAANLLGQHLDNLNAALQGYSSGEVRVEVQRGENSQQAEQQQHQQTDPDGHNQQQHQQRQHQEDSGRSGDFVQKLRLGLFSLEDAN